MQRGRGSGRQKGMRLSQKGAAAALAVILAALILGCASGTPASGPSSSRTATVDFGIAAASKDTAGQSRAVPPDIAVSFAKVKAGPDGDRLALLSARTGALLRWLTPTPVNATDEVLSLRGGWVYYVRFPMNLEPGARSAGPAVWRIRVTGGPAQLVQTGASDYALSPDGRAVAYVTTTGNAVDVVARDLATGKRNTITLAAKPDPAANNWPPAVPGLTWAPDDRHLAVQFEPTAAFSTVLAFSAFTARTIRDGRTPPSSCLAAAHGQCQESGPAYLASGALSYLEWLSTTGAGRTSLLAWSPGQRPATLVTFPAVAPLSFYDMTSQGQAVWAAYQARPMAPQLLWRWTGGAPVKIATMPPRGASAYNGAGSVAW